MCITLHIPSGQKILGTAGLICQFSISCPVPTPHAPIAWSYHLGAWDGVGTARTTQSGRYGPEKLSRPAGSTERRWGAFLPVPSRGTRRHRWVRVSNRHAARAIAGNSSPRGGFPAGRSNPPLSFTNIGFSGCSRSPILVAIDSINQQGEALRLHFEAVVAAVELPVPRGKLKNRIKTFLGNPLCRGVDELCTELLNARDSLISSSLEIDGGAP